MSTTPSFFVKIENEIVSLFHKEETIAQKIATFANNLVNELKGLQANKTVQFLESGIVAVAESVDPALTPLISGIELELPKIVTLVSNGAAILNDTAQGQVNTLAEYLEKLKGINGTVYAGILATLSAAIQAFITNNAGIAATDSQLIVAGQAVHAAS
ncbi:MAG: hypothetical protein ACHQF4_02430 [Sphingobacteriales bacterium]|jgi:hypothetical protein